MYITNPLIDFLKSSSNLSNSNIILTDLEKIVFASSDIEKDYLNSRLSNTLLQILNFVCLPSTSYFNTTVNTIIPLIIDDNVSKYKSQIILPIFHDDIPEGLLIFFTDNRTYLPSNLKFAKTTKHFVELFSTKDYL